LPFELSTWEETLMKLIAGAAVIAFGIASAVAADQQAASQAQKQGERVATAALAPNEVTLVGCVEFEQDYRKRMAAGRGGALGSGVGANDEFVLTNTRPAASQVGTTGSGSTQARNAGRATAGNAGSGGGVYTLTGAQEKNLKRDVGRQVEVVGVIENAGKPSTGAELTDISDLPRIAIKTWHPVNDFCPGR
jgi:hypothetical protein